MHRTQTLKFLLIVVIALFGAGCSSLNSGGGPGPNFEEPLIGISSETLDFGWTGRERELTLYNTGGGTLEWYIQDFPGWVNPSFTEGAVSVSAPETVVFELDRGALESGENQGAIKLTSNGGDLILTVLAEQADSAVLGELPSQLDFGEFDDLLEFELYNAGRDTLIWSIAAQDTYISVSPDSGEITDQVTISLSLNRENAPEGSISSGVSVTSNGGTAQMLLSALNGNAEGRWLSHFDNTDGYYQAMPEDYYYVVRFDRPEGWDNFKITYVQLALHTLPGAWDDVKLLCWGVFSDQGIVWPDLNDLLYATPILDPIQGWNLWSVDWTLDQDVFCIGYLQYNVYQDISPDAYYDAMFPAGHSYLVWEASSSSLMMELLWQWEWCIEAYVEPDDGAAGFRVQGGQWLTPEGVFPERTASHPSGGELCQVRIGDKMPTRPNSR